MGTSTAMAILLQKLCPHPLQTVVSWPPTGPKDLCSDPPLCKPLHKVYPPEDRLRERVGAGPGIRLEPFKQRTLGHWHPQRRRWMRRGTAGGGPEWGSWECKAWGSEPSHPDLSHMAQGQAESFYTAVKEESQRSVKIEHSAWVV